MNPNDFLKKMTEWRKGTEDPVPSGYYTVGELCQKWNLSEGYVTRIVKRALAAGKLKKITLRRMVINRLQKVNYYG